MSQSRGLLLAALFVAIGFFALRGCGRYGEVSEPAYEIAKALISVCNQKDAARLETVAALISDGASNGRLSSAEVRWLMQIVEQSRKDNWSEASMMCRRLMQDQVTY